MTRRQRIAAAVLAAICASSRLAALARSPWDWDEILFCLGLRSYDVAQHHPHPPGFPLFIALGRVARLVIHDDFRALQAVSTLFAMLLFPAMLMLGRALRLRAETAMAGAALCAFFPNVWFFGGTAFSDVTSIVLVVFAVALLLRGRDVEGAIALAASAAIRPQNLLIGLFPALRRPRWRAIPAAAAVLAIAYGSAIRATGGFARYLTAVRTHAAFISSVDSFRSPSRPPLWTLFDDFFVKNYQWALFGYITTAFVIASLVAAIRSRDRRIGALLLTFAPFALFAWLMLDRFSISRFSIGYAPLFALLAAHGIESLARGRVVAQAAVSVVLIAGFAVYTLPALAAVRADDSPPVRAALAARAIAAPHQLYVARAMEPFADYYLPGEPYVRVADIRALPLGAPAAQPWLLAEGGATFHRPRGRAWHIARRAYFETTLAPIRELPQFLDGWYAPERLGHEEWRWTSGHAIARLPAVNGDAVLALNFDIPDEQRPPRITIMLNGVIVDRFVPESGRMEKEYHVGGGNMLEIDVDPTYRETTGRNLGMLIRFLSWGPA